jgi:hypothetical protein
MTTDPADDSNDPPVPAAANLLFNAASAARRFFNDAAPRAADSTELRIAKHCFRYLAVATGAAAIAMFVLQPGAENA